MGSEKDFFKQTFLSINLSSPSPFTLPIFSVLSQSLENLNLPSGPTIVHTALLKMDLLRADEIKEGLCKFPVAVTNISAA
jgi:hypothetical protein